MFDNLYNLCKSVSIKLTSFMNDKFNNLSKLYESIYRHKKETLKTTNSIVISTFTVLSLVTSIFKIFYKTVRHQYTRYNQKRECIYTYHGKRYRIYFKQQKYYSSRIIEAHDLLHNKNILDRIKEYAGPYENFHHESITPGNLGYEHIRITTMIGGEIVVKEYNKDDIIII